MPDSFANSIARRASPGSLQEIEGITVFDQPAGVKRENNSYFPILVGEDYPLSRDELYEKLKQNNIYTRRYFYPLISELSIYKDLELSDKKSSFVATQIAAKVLKIAGHCSKNQKHSVTHAKQKDEERRGF